MKEARFPFRNDAFKYENEVPKMVLHMLFAKHSDDFDFRQKKCPKF